MSNKNLFENELLINLATNQAIDNDLFEDLGNFSYRKETNYSFEELFSQLKKELTIVNTVYRIENKEKLGPYSEDFWQMISQTPANGRPTPNMDDGFGNCFKNQFDYDLQKGWFDIFKKTASKENINLLFGFSSETQLYKWFNHIEENKKLFSSGFKIKKYENIIGIDSGIQVVFWNNLKIK